MANTLRFKRGLAAGIPTGVAGEPLFTTDTFDLYIGNGTGNTRFQKYIASGTTSQYLRGDGTLATFPSLTGFVPYTGATANVDLGVYTILAQNATISSSGSGNTATITHSSGSGIALNITKGGNGEGLYINKTSGSGNAATIIGTLNATTLVKSGGTSTQYLMADGSTSTLTNPITGTGTTNYLPKFTGASTLGNSLVYDNGSFVGINTTTNGGILSINGVDPLIGFQNAGSTKWQVGLENTSSDRFIWYNNAGASYRMILTSTGNLLLGSTTDSGEKLQVTGTGYFSGSVGIARTPSASYKLHVAGDVAYEVTSGNVGFSLISGSDSYSFYLNDADNSYRIYSSIGAVDRFVLTSGGNLLVGGTSDSGEKLQVTGTMKVTGNTTIGGTYTHTGGNNTIVSQSNTATTGYQYHNMQSTGARLIWGIEGNPSASVFNNTLANAAVIGSASATGAFQIATASTVRATFDSSGNLGLGVVPSAWSLGSAIDIAQGPAILGYVNETYLSNNSYFNAGWKFKQTSYATMYVQNSTGQHQWHIGGTGTAGNAISFTQAMTLTSGGNLLVGTTTDSGDKLQVNGTAKITGAATFSSELTSIGTASLAVGQTTDLLYVGDRTTVNTRYIKFIRASALTDIVQIQGMNGGVGTESISLQASGSNVLIGQTNDTGEKLQVNGTAKITGATTIGGSVTINGTTLDINPSSGNPNIPLRTGNTFRGYIEGNANGMSFGTGAAATICLTLDNSGAANFLSSVTAGQGYFTHSDTPVRLNSSGTTLTQLDFLNGGTQKAAIWWNNSTNTFNFYSGVTALTIASTGAATFSSSATIATTSTTGYSLVVQNSGASDTTGIRLTSGGTDNGYFITAYNAVSKYASLQAGDNDAYRSIILNNLGGNVGIGMSTASYKLDVTGEARISSAIAIGTTPDSNNPFKILKNLNTTVGIKFENTNTSSSAFSAVQLGTDVSGGTKFTNLVYASSGISASGVYNPDGTSLINNGNGGLNFLGNPIRMYTGGSNGVLRLYFDNEGTTQLNATSPTTSITDGYRQYSADITAGNAAAHFRTENGAVIKLYQETTSVGNSIFSAGGGNSVLDDSTFDGYTLRQIVKALRNQGILA